MVNSKSLPKDQIIKLSSEYSHQLLAHFPSIHGILVTIGKHGIVYVSRDTTFQGPMHLGPQSSLFESNTKTSNSLFLPQEQVHQVSNVSGAGDCLVGALICSLLRQQPIQSSLQLGLKAAQLSVTVEDTVPINIQQILTKV